MDNGLNPTTTLGCGTWGGSSISENVGPEHLINVKRIANGLIEPDELEQAAYNFVQFYREGGEMHERGGCAVLVESVIFTKEKMAAMGIPEGVVPEGWWIGFKVTDDEVWEKVKDGTYPMFSIEGEAVREEVDDEEPEN